MPRITWRVRDIFRNIVIQIQWQWFLFTIGTKSLFYNIYIDREYIADTLMEPMFWIVDNFTKFLGPIFVIAVSLLSTMVVIIAWWLGLPFWWNRSYICTILLIILGNWILLNVVFHYVMAAITSPGIPPQGALIPDAVSICRKCIAPKPPRTHHCSVCNRCVLKMDHHCPWLNNCIGHFNHRYFFLYMVYKCLGVLFVMIFGCEIGYNEMYGEDDSIDEVLEGHPVYVNSSGILRMMEILPENMTHLEENEEIYQRNYKRGSVIYAGLSCTGTFLALGALMWWHARIITRGETSIESHINKTEVKKLGVHGKKHINPYDFGPRKNWRLFLGMVDGRGWRHILLPSMHKPQGNGLTFKTICDMDNFLDD